ncbi:MAG: class I SAM-dependent methyltransferase [Nitrospirae bacterium]|nr:class I SAM-dependent methyltransferase [Nitrospirota bacterium]
MKLQTIYISFPSRDKRGKFVASHFAGYLNESVLDVGCFEATIRDIIGQSSYVGVDIAGKPDITLNLEKIERLPFEDNSFKTVLCIDVLEHLDNFHVIFEELKRVSSGSIIVSLPNCWRDARRPISRGKGQFAHYGLPLHIPLHRHKWFFNITEAKDFIIGKAKELDLQITDMFITEKPGKTIIRWLRMLRYPGNRYHNRYSATLWTVLKKNNL